MCTSQPGRPAGGGPPALGAAKRRPNRPIGPCRRSARTRASCSIVPKPGISYCSARRLPAGAAALPCTPVPSFGRVASCSCASLTARYTAAITVPLHDSSLRSSDPAASKQKQKQAPLLPGSDRALCSEWHARYGVAPIELLCRRSGRRDQQAKQ